MLAENTPKYLPSRIILGASMNMQDLAHAMAALSLRTSGNTPTTLPSMHINLKVPNGIRYLLIRLSKNWKHIDNLNEGSYEWAQKVATLLRSEERLNMLLEKQRLFKGKTISFGALTNNTEVVRVEEYNTCNLFYFRIFAEYWKWREGGEEEENCLRESVSWKNVLRAIEQEERMVEEWEVITKATAKGRPCTPVKNFVAKVAREPPFLWSLKRALLEMHGYQDEDGNPSHSNRPKNLRPTGAQSKSSIQPIKADGREATRRAISVTRILDFATQDLDPRSANWRLLAQIVLFDQQRLERGKRALRFRSAQLQSIECFKRTHFENLSYKLDRGIRVPHEVLAGMLHRIESADRIEDVTLRSLAFRPETKFETEALGQFRRANEEDSRAREILVDYIEESMDARAQLDELRREPSGLAEDRLNDIKRRCHDMGLMSKIAGTNIEHAWNELVRAADVFDNMERTKRRRGQ